MGITAGKTSRCWEFGVSPGVLVAPNLRDINDPIAEETINMIGSPNGHQMALSTGGGKWWNGGVAYPMLALASVANCLERKAWSALK